ncbi:hypothetical protein OOT00_15230 [Desulfobotulus sp. H1]|uniref:Uncharacterized protein n=1 Tax=Desulfobotulus pelophilus TaxID=2823377 RepID=A0ABT3NCY6_9BACT|nr:hypothetical protein [Desulfobotulus pelophilus]MCW7755335.1 hypothetical protein [Desulfobotulus pelophilus]
MTGDKRENMEIAKEVSKVVSENLRGVLNSALTAMGEKRTLRAIDLGEISSVADYRDTYREGGGHNEQYRDSYSEDGYKNHYSDTRSALLTKIRPEDFTKETLFLEAEKLKAEIAAKNALIERLQAAGGRIG